MPLKEITMVMNCVGINVLIYCFEDKLYDRKYGKAVHYAVVAFCIFLNAFVSILQIPVLNPLCVLTIMMVTTVSLFQTEGCALREKVCYIYNLCFCAGLFLMNFIMTKVLEMFVNGRLNNWLYRELFFFISTILVLIFDIVFYNILTEIIKKSRTGAFRTLVYENLFLVVFCIFEMWVFLYLILMDSGSKNLGMTMIVFGITFLALLLCQLYMNRRTAVYYELVRKKEQEALSKEWINKYYERLEEQELLYRKMNHDVNKHLNTITQLLHNGESAQAEVYIDEVGQHISKLVGPFTFSNKVLQVIINESFYKCREYKIRFSVHVEDLDLSFIESYDLTTLLSNLMENAIEACCTLQEADRFIVMRLYEYAAYLNIYIENGTACPLNIINGNVVSTKDNHPALGLQNVQEVVRKYDGNLKIECEDTFTVKISILKA